VKAKRILFMTSMSLGRLPFVDQQVRLVRAAGAEVAVISRVATEPLPSGDMLYDGFVNHEVRLAEALSCLLRVKTRSVFDRRFARFIDAEARWSEMGLLLGAKRARRWSEIAAAAVAFRPDLIHVHFAWHLPFAIPLANYLGVPIVCTLHGSDVYLEEEWKVDLPNPAIGRAIAVSDSLAKYVSTHSPSGSAKTDLVHNALNPDFFRPCEPAPDGLRLIHVAGFRKVKNHSWLVRALARLERRGVPFTCDLVGDGEGLPAIRDQVAAAGLAERVRFLGWQSHDEVMAAIDRSTALCLTSESEGLPTVVIEALCRQRGVVATDLPGTRDASRGGQYASLVPLNDDDAFADALESILADSPQHRSLAEAARRWIVETFHPDVHLGLLSDVYRRALA
jgi:glycosyltransferase involved in cell wall biosynthesis